MKRVFIIALVLCLLLTGCGISGNTPGTTQGAASSEPAGEPDRETSLLDRREAFDGSGVLWYIPNAQIEALEYPVLRSFAGKLLVTSSDYLDEGKSRLTFTLLSGETGEALQSSTIESGSTPEIQVIGGHVAVCDGSSGTVVVLDEALRETARYTSAADSGQWFLGSDLDTLYKFSYLDGIRAVSLSTGKELFPLALAELSVCSVRDTNICFTGVDLETQRYRAACLDLASGALEEPPFPGDFYRIDHSGKMWLADFNGSENTFVFGADADGRVATAQDGTFSLFDSTGHVGFTDYNGNVTIYDAQGSFLSSCGLAGWYLQNFVWREELGGYLLLAYSNEGSSRLLFWDINAGAKGERLKTQSLAEYDAVPGGSSADASLYQRAKSLSDRFGVEIRIADQCDTEFPYFNCYQVSDDASVSAGLDMLENALSCFPEGFFRQLAYGHINGLQFQLIGGLTATGGFGGDTSYAAFTDTSGTVCRIVLDLYSININSVWHELSHAIDKRLAWDATYRENALFSEEAWLSYNPQGFSYSEEYGTQRSDISSDWYSYFVDDYAMTNATEDRARIFEYAIDNSSTLFSEAGLKAKLQYYSECIRDCFDTAQWPETTAWEASLR